MSVRSAIAIGAGLLAVSGACLAGLLLYGQALSDTEVAEGKLLTPEERAARLAEAQRRFAAMTPAEHLAAARDALARGYAGGEVHVAASHLRAVPRDAPVGAELAELRLEVAWRRAAGYGGAPPAAYARLRDPADVAPSREGSGAHAPCLRATSGASTWQAHRAQGPVCFGRTFAQHGDPGEYALAVVPPAGDAAWREVASPIINLAEESALCGSPCTCLDGGRFTYFQTTFERPAGRATPSLTVTVAGADDGARVTVNGRERLPRAGDTGSYLMLGGIRATGDLGGFVVTGTNRVVITHLDDCCFESGLLGVRVVLDGAPLRACAPGGGG